MWHTWGGHNSTPPPLHTYEREDVGQEEPVAPVLSGNRPNCNIEEQKRFAKLATFADRVFEEGTALGYVEDKTGVQVSRIT